MTFNYDLTADDFVQAQHLFLRKTLGKRFGLVLIVFVFLVILGIYCLWGWLSGKNPPATGLWAADVGVLFTYVWIWSGIPWKKEFRRTRALHSSMELTVGEDEIAYKNERGDSRTKWSALEDWQESKSLFLLYPQPRMFFIVPKRVMQPDQIAALRESLIAKIQKTKA
jgi:hypothetical protein